MASAISSDMGMSPTQKPYVAMIILLGLGKRLLLSMYAGLDALELQQLFYT